MSFLEFFDLFDKNNSEELKSHTTTGNVLSLIITILGTVLFLAEFMLYASPDIYRDLSVDPSFGNGQELVNISLSVLVDTPCYFLHLDTIDSLGYQDLYVNSTITFRRMTPTRQIIGISNLTMKDDYGSCYNLSDHLLYCTCEQLKYLAQLNKVKEEPEKWEQCKNKKDIKISMDEKCMIKGKLTVNKVRGNFHIAPGINVLNNPYGHSFNPMLNLKLTHKIERIRFGPHIPRTSNPLSNLNMKVDFPFGMLSYRYHCIVTPIKFVKDNQEVRRGYEYTVLPLLSLSSPMIFFDYTFTPYTIVVTLNRKSPLQFISSTFGVISGIFAIATLFDSLFDGEAPKSL